MPVCPNQHESRTPDFCEVCGVQIPPEAGRAATADRTGGAQEVCPACHAEHDPAVGDFCEVCGYNFKTGAGPVPPPAEPAPVAGQVAAAAPPPPETVEPLPWSDWELVIAVAPNPHIGMPDAELPPSFAGQVLPLVGDALLIGRRSVRRNILPEISLDHDDGVSHRHAQLTRTPEGAFSLSDLGSSNGTTLNGTDVASGTPVTLKEGDSIALGRWTNLTLRRVGLPAGSSLAPSPHPPASA